MSDTSQTINSNSYRCKISSFFLTISKYKSLRKIAFRAALRLEKGQFFSLTAREILSKHYGVVVGEYSYGECMIPGSFSPGITVGRYVSMAHGIKVLLRNHPVKWLSMHPFFYNPSLGLVNNDPIPFGSCTIGHDAWIGEGVIITPGCTHIGIGAVIGAGAVVTKNVPDFAIIAGVPARIIRFRFSPDICDLIRYSRWWEKSLLECAQIIDEMQQDITVNPCLHPFLKSSLTSCAGRTIPDSWIAS